MHVTYLKAKKQVQAIPYKNIVLASSLLHSHVVHFALSMLFVSKFTHLLAHKWMFLMHGTDITLH